MSRIEIAFAIVTCVLCAGAKAQHLYDDRRRKDGEERMADDAAN